MEEREQRLCEYRFILKVGLGPRSALDIHRLETLVRELKQQARLPHARVTDDDVLEEVCVAHGLDLSSTGRCQIN